MKNYRMYMHMLPMILGAGLLGGCAMGPATPLTNNSQAEIRTATHEFASAVRTGDAQRVRQVTADGAPSDRLSQEVIRDTVGGRMVLSELQKQFQYVEEKPGVVGSETWLSNMESAAVAGRIQRVAPDRVRIQVNGGADVYVREVDGSWKVELIPTLVDESNGQPTVDDPAVEYRFGVTRAMKEWMLTRLQRNEFKSKEEFDEARETLWMQYLQVAANGRDPRDMVLPSLPPMPLQESGSVDER